MAAPSSSFATNPQPSGGACCEHTREAALRQGAAAGCRAYRAIFPAPREKPHPAHAALFRIGRLAFDDARQHVGRIVPAVRPKPPPIGRQMRAELGPPLLPPPRKADEVLHRGGIREDARLLVAALVKPLHPHRRREPLYGPCEAAPAVVALDRRLPHVGALQHRRHLPFGHLHRLARVDRIDDADPPVRIHRIGQRTQVIVPRVGRVDIGRPPNDFVRQPLVLPEAAPVQQPVRRRGVPLVHRLELQRIEPPLAA